VGQLSSILQKYRLGKTIPLFPHDEHYTQCCDSSRDRAEKAIFGGPVVIGSLQERLSLQDKINVVRK